MQDVFAVQEELAHSIAATIGGKVEAVGRDRATHANPAALQAYDLVLRAKALYLKYSMLTNEQARAFAAQAIEIDPTSAQAHAYFARCCFLEYIAHWVVNRDDSLQRAYKFAKKAVTLDESDIEARYMLGMVLLARREFEEAHIHFTKALELNANDTGARCMFAFYLDCIGQRDTAIEQYDLAKRQNPFDLSWMPWLKGAAYFGARRYEEAIATFNQIVDPINEVRGLLAASYAHVGRTAEAKAKLEEFLRVAEHDMAVFPGRKLSDWKRYWHSVAFYRDQHDFDHLFDGLRKAGLQD
jgi:adenylate cyclase